MTRLLARAPPAPVPAWRAARWPCAPPPPAWPWSRPARCAGGSGRSPRPAPAHSRCAARWGQRKGGLEEVCAARRRFHGTAVLVQNIGDTLQCATLALILKACLRDVWGQARVRGRQCNQVLRGRLRLRFLQTVALCIAICMGRPSLSWAARRNLGAAAPELRCRARCRLLGPFPITCRACRRRRVASTSSRSAATSRSRAARSAVSCFSCPALAATEPCSRSSCLRTCKRQMPQYSRCRGRCTTHCC